MIIVFCCLFRKTIFRLSEIFESVEAVSSGQSRLSELISASNAVKVSAGAIKAVVDQSAQGVGDIKKAVVKMLEEKRKMALVD